jgi:hypothetical protein
LAYPRQSYSSSQRGRRERNAAEILRIQRIWAQTFSPGSQPPDILRDGRYLLAVGDNESAMGLSHATGSYRGWFQLSMRSGYCMLAEASFQRALVTRLNAMRERDPSVTLQVNGRSVPWTTAHLRQYWERNPYIQTAAALESAHINWGRLNLGRATGLSAAQQAALVYMSHVQPGIARLIAANISSEESLEDIVSRVPNRRRPGQRTTAQVWQYHMDANPSVFDGGEHTPRATLDRWVQARYTPTNRAFAHLLPQPSPVVAATSGAPRFQLLAPPAPYARDPRFTLHP